MMNESLLPRIRRIVADVFNLPELAVTDQTARDHLPAWDSLQHLNVVLAVEQEFELSFSPEEMEAMDNVASIAALVSQKGHPGATKQE